MYKRPSFIFSHNSVSMHMLTRHCVHIVARVLRLCCAEIWNCVSNNNRCLFHSVQTSGVKDYFTDSRSNKQLVRDKMCCLSSTTWIWCSHVCTWALRGNIVLSSSKTSYFAVRRELFPFSPSHLFVLVYERCAVREWKLFCARACEPESIFLRSHRV